MLSRKAARSRAEPPLNSILRRVLAGATTGHSRGAALRKTPINIHKDPKAKHFSRIEIVSEKLCDDLIAYLAPTLKPYKGCTILDVHPGACLWSRKLHEFLKPKCHILMEPDGLYTQEFIKPLLDMPKSKYRHFEQPFVNPVTGSYSHPYAQALEFARKTGMRDVPTLSTSTRDYDDPRLRLIDSKILMTGNLGRIYPKRPPLNIFTHEVQAALDNKSIHRNGLVRQLFWVPDDPRLKVLICPQVITGRSSGNLLTALAADVTEVAGAQFATRVSKGKDSSFIRGRNACLSAEQRWEVQARMEDAGMHVPYGRRLLRHPTPPESQETELGDLRNPFEIVHTTIEEVDRAIGSFEDYISTLRSIAPNWSHFPSDDKIYQPILRNLEYPQSLPSAIENTTSPKHATSSTLVTTLAAQRKAIYLDTMLRMINLETHVVSLRDQNLPIDNLQSRLQALDAEISGKLLGTIAVNSAPILEDQLLHFSHPKNLMYDNRPYDPLLCFPQEFWPPSSSGLALYDCIPSTIDLDVESIAPRSEVLKLARELVKLLYPLKNTPIPTALDRVAPNAAEDLIPKIREITDPRRGGRLDAGKVVTKMMSPGMFEGLVRAWWEWPFRPERWELEAEGSVGMRLPEGGEWSGKWSGER